MYKTVKKERMAESVTKRLVDARPIGCFSAEKGVGGPCFPICAFK